MKEDKKLPKLQSIFWLQEFSNDYVDIKQVVQNKTFRKNTGYDSNYKELET